ncbi:MAG: hypothetical protein P8M22_12325 [Phycisphaerales bacterium]|nr:hypothetical protein [Phycisphaerales bacterium]
MIWMLLPLAMFSAGFISEESPTYDPTDPSQVAEAEDEDPGLAGPAVEEETLDPGGGRRGEMMAEGMGNLSIEGVLEARCGQCHGPRKQKAGVQVVPIESMFTGPRQDWVVIPGQPSQSSLVERIVLPAGHDDVMPPEGAPLTKDQIQKIQDWVSNGADAKAAREGAGISMNQGQRGQRNRQVRPRAWMEAYMALDLTPEQRSSALDTGRKLQRETRAFQEQWGGEMQKLQKQLNQSGRDQTDESIKLRKELQEIKAKQPDVTSIQESLWNALDSKQQLKMRDALEKLKQDRRGSRMNRPRGAGKQQPGANRPMDEETRRRLRFLLDERRKTGQEESSTDSDSD